MDRKLETLLTVCRTMNYRMAAEQLHLTQPAVTKQIRALESEYQTKLFIYDGRRLIKTDKCAVLESYARSLEYNYEEMRLAMQEKERLHLRVGATKTIGDYVIDQAVLNYLLDARHELTLIVDNTQQLLKRLDEHDLDFAIMEGCFDKRKYHHQLFRNEPLIGVRRAAPHAEKALPAFELEELFAETIIIREKGSGTRELFERNLERLGYSLDAFSRVIELSSVKLICEAVKAGIGISFLYRSVVGEAPDYQQFIVSGITQEHEFNVVSLKQTKAQDYANQFLQDIAIRGNGE